MAAANIKWDLTKNEWLKANRGVSFEAVSAAFEAGDIIDDLEHPRRPNQRIAILKLNDYICAVPYVRDGESIFLKTIYPDRKLNAEYEKAR